jgi:hypothetical protein
VSAVYKKKKDVEQERKKINGRSGRLAKGTKCVGSRDFDPVLKGK